MASSRHKLVNIYVLGAGDSGKSSFIRMLVKNQNCQTVKLGKRCYAMELDLSGILGIPVLINITEFRGIKHYGKLRFQYASADACLLFYDCNDKSSFYKACNLHWWCHYLIFGTPPTFLVGNKSDLFTNDRVDTGFIDQFMNKYQRIKGHFEISTNTGRKIKELFQAVFKQLSSKDDNQEIAYSQLCTEEEFKSGVDTRVRELAPYDASGAYPGICLVVNNNSFQTDNLHIRRGSEKDVENIKSTFSDIGFEIRVAENLDASTLKKRLLDISKLDHTENNMFICFVMSHGLPYSVYGVDGLPIDIKRLTDPFSARLCPTLAGKPKIFIIQACRGQKMQKAAVDVSDHAAASDATTERPSVPEFADSLVGYSTINGFVSYRDTERGSFYIRTLCETVKRCPDLHIVDILTIVNREVAEMDFPVSNPEYAEAQFLESYKQMPMFESSLTKQAFLPHRKDVFDDPDSMSESQ